MRRILLLIIFLIVYGSLYPWHFAASPLSQNPFWILVHSGKSRLNLFALRDAIVNIAVYIPLGMCAHFAFRKRGPALFDIYGPVLLGLALSVVMEMAQVFVPLRTTSMLDVLTNVIGAAVGVGLALVAEEVAGPFSVKMHSLKASDRGALILFFFWAGFLLFPFFPHLGAYEASQRLKILIAAPVFDPVPLISTAASWFAAGKLIEAAGIRHTRIALALAMLSIPAQLFIAGRQPRSADLAGALAGFLLFLLFGQNVRKIPAYQAIAFLMVLVFRGFAPFHFLSASQGFTLIPFGGFLSTGWQEGLLVLLEKAFFYGTAVWLLRASGLRLANAVALTATTLLVIEVAQTHLPGRTAEITDPLLAMLIGFGLGIV